MSKLERLWFPAERRTWERRTWFRQRFGRETDRRDAEVIAARLVARAVARRREQQVAAPAQVKSSEEITRDESGEVIPEDRRLDPASPDINYSRPLDPAKIPAILDGSYVPDIDDQLAATSIRNAVTYDRVAREAFGGVPPSVSPHLSSDYQRVGRSALAELYGPRLTIFTPNGSVAPRGLHARNAVSIHADEVERAHLIAGHELWHWLRGSREDLTRLVGSIVERATDPLGFESKAREYAANYPRPGEAEQVVVANLFASALGDPLFWEGVNPHIANALRALPGAAG